MPPTEKYNLLLKKIPCSSCGMFLKEADIFFIFLIISLLSLNLNQPQVDKSIIEIFFKDFFAKVLGKVDGGKKTINFPFDFVTKSSICFSDTLLFGKFANINSSVLFDLGHLSFFNLSAEPRTI